MIDDQNGDVIFREGMRLGASMTREQFLDSELGRNAKKFIGNGPYCSYRIEARLEGGDRFLVIPFFHGERMDAVWLISLEVGYAGDEEFGPESEKAEFERKKWHDRWLASVLGASSPHHFAWGLAASVYDQRSMSSQIVIRYGGAAVGEIEEG
jgi:hypothetical protein